MRTTVRRPRLRVAFAEAALDVWYQYPTGPGPTFPVCHALQTLPNVLMTPHVSGWTEGMLGARATLIAENIQRAARGEPPVHLIPASAAYAGSCAAIGEDLRGWDCC